MAVLPVLCYMVSTLQHVWRYDVMYGSVLAPLSVLKSTGKYYLTKTCMVTLPLPILKSKGKYRMAMKPSHV